MDIGQTDMPGDNRKKHMTTSLNFFKHTLDNMEKMRDETWSDITLKVGCRFLYAHRLVLAAHSGYFKTLFLSNFSDSKSKEVDLSSVVDDADILESVIKYMYYGDVEYEEDEFWEVARLASYFEIEVLMELCKLRMVETVSLHNCVEYYMFAYSHGYNYIEYLTGDVIECRFHDYLVFQESTLQLRPGDMKRMLKCEFFKNCGNAPFLEFLGNWVSKGNTNQYVETGKEIIEYLDQEIKSDFTVIAHKTQMKSLEICCNELESKLNSSDAEVDKALGESFLKEMKRLVNQIIGATEIPVDDEENVLFALCERKKKWMLLDPETERKNTKNNRSASSKTKRDSDSVYDLFVFRERSNCWYHINTVESHPYWYNEKVLPYQRKHRDCFIVDKTLIFVTRNSKNALKFDLEKNKWSQLRLRAKKNRSGSRPLWEDLLSHMSEKDDKLSDIGNHFAVSNNELYAVIVKPDVDLLSDRYSDEPVEINGCYFKICKVDIQDGYLTEVVRTGIQPLLYELYLSDLSRYEGIRTSARVQINEASGDMLVLVCIDDDLGDGEFREYISLVVNVKDGSSHFFPAETNDQLKYPFHDLHTVEKDNSFLIVRHFGEASYDVIAEYIFLSKEIIFRKGIVKPDPESSWYFRNTELGESTLYNGVRGGLWYFGGFFNYRCDLRYIPLEEVEKRTEDKTTEVIGNEKINDGRNVEDEVHEDMDPEVKVNKARLAEEDVVTEKENAERYDNGTAEGNVDEDKKSDMNKNVSAEGQLSKDKTVEGVNENRKVEDINSDGSVSDDWSTEDSETECVFIEGIPPPFTMVKCACEAKMDKEFLSKLKPVKMFLL